MKAFFIFLLFTLFSSHTFATNEVVTTTLFGVDNSNVKVIYDPNFDYGFSISEAQEISIDNIYNFVNSMIVRRKGFGDRVYVVPRSTVGIYANTKNLSSSSIEIFDYKLFISRSNLNNGDLTRLGMSSDGIYLGRKYAINSVNQTIESNESINGFQLYSFEVTQPLLLQNYIVDYQIVNEGLKIYFNVILENQSDYDLCNIELSQKLPSGNQYINSICINPHSSIEVSYTDTINHPVSQTIDIEKLTITDNNWHFESISTQKTNEFDTTLETTSLILNTSIGEFMAAGSIENNMSIVLTPYSIVTSERSVFLEKQIEVSLEKNSLKLENGVNTNIELILLNKGLHIYNQEAQINLVSPDLELISQTLLISNQKFGEIKTYNIPIRTMSVEPGVYFGTLQISIDQSEYEVVFKYELKNKKIKVIESNSKKRSKTNLSSNLQIIKTANSGYNSGNQDIKHEESIKGVYVDKQEPFSNQSFHQSSSKVLSIAIACFVLFLIIIFILIWLW